MMNFATEINETKEKVFWSTFFAEMLNMSETGAKASNFSKFIEFSF